MSTVRDSVSGYGGSGSDVRWQWWCDNSGGSGGIVVLLWGCCGGVAGSLLYYWRARLVASRHTDDGGWLIGVIQSGEVG